MGSLSIMHWLIVLSVLSIILGYVFPIVKILQRAGFSGWWVLIGFIPFANFIGLWVFALVPWPSLATSHMPSYPPDAR
jgi:hypothetical protein